MSNIGISAIYFDGRTGHITTEQDMPLPKMQVKALSNLAKEVFRLRDEAIERELCAKSPKKLAEMITCGKTPEKIVVASRLLVRKVLLGALIAGAGKDSQMTRAP